MTGARVLLMTLAERTSERGNTYLSGWLGKARVGFKAKDLEPTRKAHSDQTPRRNAELGQAGWDRSRDAARARDAQRLFYDASDFARADLEECR